MRWMSSCCGSGSNPLADNAITGRPPRPRPIRPGEGAKYWLRVLTEIKNRGTKDCLIVVCDGLTGLPDGVAAAWPQTSVQT